MVRYSFVWVLLVACSGASPSGGTTPGGSSDRTLVNRDSHRVALLGHDPVAYFTDGRPVAGDPAVTAEHRGAVYRFASEEHRRSFAAEPDRYAPQFGGYCGYAASIKRLSSIDPALFQILDGRLVLQNSQAALDLWNRDVARNLRRADDNWPDLVEENAHPARVLVNVDAEGIAIGGYDPMSFHEGAPALGEAAHVGNHDGATYRFRTQASRFAFEDHPRRHRPDFGGYCAWGVSQGQLQPITPTVYEIVDGQLLFFRDEAARTSFDADREASLRRALGRWPQLLAQHGS